MEAEKVLNSLSNAEKYDLLTNHVKPEEDVSKTPKPRRKFCTSWLTKYPWMVYSYIMSGAYCLPCALFALWKHQRGQLVVKPFQNLKKMVEKANSHAVSKYHLDAIEMAYTFVQQRKDPSSTVACKLDTKRAENVRRNRQILDCVIRSVMLCGQQCLPLRGDHEQFGADGNPGNFLAVLHFLAVYYPVLDQHLKSPAMRNAKMTSPRIQNEVIDVMAQHFIVSQLVKEVKEAKNFLSNGG